MMSAGEVNYDETLDKVGNLIDTLDNYISGLSNQPITFGEWWTLGVAGIAAAVSVISIFVTVSGNKKNIKSNEKIAERVEDGENKRLDAVISADIKAKARIEWIQNVRHAAAELISVSYKYIAAENNEYKELKLDLLEKKALFVLYFGPDEEAGSYIAQVDLLDISTNKGKNNRLVDFVNTLVNETLEFHRNKDEIADCRKELNRCSGCYDMNDTQDDYEKVRYECVKDEYGTCFNEEDCREHEDSYKQKENNALRRNETVNLKLQQLSEIMRIYGKIEWKRAKENK